MVAEPSRNEILAKKKTLGQYFTTGVWLSPEIKTVIDELDFTTVVDPFAGQGDLLNYFLNYKHIGYDIDPNLNQWITNDSLVNIPRHDNALCVTNPPYLANYTAKRYKRTDAYRYFNENPEHDLYLIAIRRCLEAFDSVVAIVPETYLFTKLFRERLQVVDILEKSPFDDTGFPVVVAFWSSSIMTDFAICKNGQCIGTWNEIQDCIPSAIDPALHVKFNSVDGQIGLVGIDGTKEDIIRFCDPEEIGAEEIKHSSRLRTRIHLDHDTGKLDFNSIIIRANIALNRLRKDTHDVVLAPFKGNRKNGSRRRRLDYKIAKLLLHHSELHAR